MDNIDEIELFIGGNGLLLNYLNLIIWVNTQGGNK